VKLSETKGAIARRPPLHGEHGEEILREAGFTSEEIAVLRDEKAMGGPP
jgi:crotonobetainyl-CoA:carnitine CoA-transferase CaiB-like acyl-CoA transferase